MTKSQLTVGSNVRTSRALSKSDLSGRTTQGGRVTGGAYLAGPASAASTRPYREAADAAMARLHLASGAAGHVDGHDLVVDGASVTP